jgi:hypothetical protein
MLGDQLVSKQLWYHTSLIRLSALAQIIETLENWPMAATPKVAIFLITGVGLFVLCGWLPFCKSYCVIYTLSEAVLCPAC